MKASLIIVLAAVAALTAPWCFAGNPPEAGSQCPQATLTNGLVHVKLYLPDAHHGFYRGTRFDWSGVIVALEYKGKNFYGPWFTRVDPKVHDLAFSGAEIVSCPCSGVTGPAEEFQTNHSALGFDEAKVGGTFVKIGVGVLRKDQPQYDFVKLYDVVDPGQWTVQAHQDSVQFTHVLHDPASGYAYIYRKTVRLLPGKPEMVLEHSLKNTGRRTIQTSVYNHNFLVLEHQPPGPDFSLTFPFQIKSEHPPDKRLAEIRGNQVVFLRVLENQDLVFAPISGFSDSVRDNEIRIENRRVGAGLLMRGNRPLSFVNLWSIRSVLAVEPFVAMTIPPGQEFTWDLTYDYYTLPPRAH